MLVPPLFAATTNIFRLSAKCCEAVIKVVIVHNADKHSSDLMLLVDNTLVLCIKRSSYCISS